MATDPPRLEGEVDKDIQVLVVTVNQENLALLDTMGVSGNAVVANQCAFTDVDTVRRPNGAQVVHVRDASVGVGRNRNKALEHADRPFLLLADDDMVFRHGYEATARRWFELIPQAGVLIFNLGSSGSVRRNTESALRVTRRNYMNYGAARLGLRRLAVLENNIRFSTRFGAGAEYSNGEDSIFLRDCLAAGLEVWAVPEEVATLTEARASTWFTGYDRKYFSDKGALFFELSSRAWPLYIGAFAVRRRTMYKHETSMTSAVIAMARGAISYGLSRSQREPLSP